MPTVTQTATPGDFTYIPFPVKVFTGDAWSIRCTVVDNDISGWEAIAVVRDGDDNVTELTVTPVVGDTSSVDVGEDDAAGPAYGTWGLKLIPPDERARTYFGGPYNAEPIQVPEA